MQKNSNTTQPAVNTKNWRRQLIRKHPGSTDYASILSNAVIIFSNDRVWEGKLAWDAMENQVFFASKVDLGSDNMPDERLVYDHFWNDHWSVLASMWLQQRYGINLPTSIVRDCIMAVARKKCVHPIRAWLGGLVWDKTPRLETWMSEHAGVPLTPFTSVALGKWLISAVARVMRPGCQADHVLVLEGNKGAGKTSFFRILGGKWYTSLTYDLASKDAVQSMWGKVIAELPELSAVKRAADIERVKAFITNSTDRIRPAYGKDSQNFPRQCVLGGSINASEWLREDGERRFWPLHVGQINLIQLEADREQLWAEAYHRFQEGEKWYITDPLVLAELSGEVDSRREIDPWEAIIIKWLRGNPKEFYTTNEIINHLTTYGASYSRSDEMRVGAILRLFGHIKKKIRIEGIPRYAFYSPSSVTTVTTSKRITTTNVLPLRKNRQEAERTEQVVPEDSVVEVVPQKDGGIDGK